LLNRFGDTPIANIKTADVEDFITDLRNVSERSNAATAERLKSGHGR
jgi:hypothetical protein